MIEDDIVVEDVHGHEKYFQNHDGSNNFVFPLTLKAKTLNNGLSRNAKILKFIKLSIHH